jgi:serine/threonine protein kinase
MEGKRTKRNTLKTMKRKFSDLSLSCEKEDVELSTQSYNIKDEYEIVETLGMGTYSYVRHAIEKETNRHVAIKTSRGTNSREMLKKEYDLLKRLADDYIIKVYDFTEDESKKESYLIMEYFDGLNLDQYIERNGSLSENDSIDIINQVLCTIEELHDLGIAHRDIKPENILINSNLEVKLIDFNISKASENKEPFRPEHLRKFNSVYQTQISSPLYCAPELKNGLYYSESVDIWGAGVILFTMLFGSFKSFDLGKFKDATER